MVFKAIPVNSLAANEKGELLCTCHHKAKAQILPERPHLINLCQQPFHLWCERPEGFRSGYLAKLAICQGLRDQWCFGITALVSPDEESLVYGIACKQLWSQQVFTSATWGTLGTNWKLMAWTCWAPNGWMAWPAIWQPWIWLGLLTSKGFLWQASTLATLLVLPKLLWGQIFPTSRSGYTLCCQLSSTRALLGYMAHWKSKSKGLLSLLHSGEMTRIRFLQSTQHIANSSRTRKLPQASAGLAHTAPSISRWKPWGDS